MNIHGHESDTGIDDNTERLAMKTNHGPDQPDEPPEVALRYDCATACATRMTTMTLRMSPRSTRD